MTDISKLTEVMSALRDPDSGCPWDIEQTFASIAPFTLEEAYEVADAIEREDYAGLKDELGDLQLQVVFHAQMAQEAGLFDLQEVVDGIAEKLIRRHPHVFAEASASSADDVEAIWEAEKAKERDGGTLSGIARALPSLSRAQKLGKRAAGVGFDWPDYSGVRAKLAEETEELDVAVATADRDAQAQELGDLLFSAAQVARHLGLDPEGCLRAANERFEARFGQLESTVIAEGKRTQDLGLDELEARWQAAKVAVG